MLEIDKSVAAPQLNAKAFVHEEPLQVAKELRLWFADGQGKGVYIHDVSFSQTPKGTCAMVIYRGPVY